MKYLLIVESPSKCRTIETYANQHSNIQYKCVATKGHILSLNTPKTVDSSSLVSSIPSYSVLKHQHKTKSILGSLISKYDKVILATDDDREGEFIAWQLCSFFKLPIHTTTRIRFHEITKQAIHRSLDSITETSSVVHLNMVYSSMARQWMDYCIGFQLSPYLWKHIGAYAISCGRCQTPALELIYQNESDQYNKKAELHYSIHGQFQLSSSTPNKIVNASISIDESLFNSESCNTFFLESKTHTHTIRDITTKLQTIQPPKTYITSTLQQDMYSRYHFSPKYCMQLAQTLYETGYITYMRTDSHSLSPYIQKSAETYIEKHYGKSYIRENRRWVGNKNAQNAHECIRPTNMNTVEIKSKSQHSASLQKLYREIHRRTIQTMMIPSTQSNLTYHITSPLKDYVGILHKMIEPGWKKTLVGMDDNDSNVGVDSDSIYDTLKGMKGNDVIPIHIKTKVDQGRSTRYGIHNWLKQIETSGFGRPSTYSTMIDKVVDRGYVVSRDIEGRKQVIRHYDLKRESTSYISASFLLNTDRTETVLVGEDKNKICITDMGIVVRRFLYTYFPETFNIGYTSKLESVLDQISEGNVKWYTPCVSLHQQLLETISKRDLSQLPKWNVSLFDRVDWSVCYKRNEFIFKINDVEYGLNDYAKQHAFFLFHKYIFRENRQKEISKTIQGIDVSTFLSMYLKSNTPKAGFKQKKLGMFEGEPILLKHGMYGYYLKVGKKTHTITNSCDDMNVYTIQDAESILFEKKERENCKYKIGKGKFGPYLSVLSFETPPKTIYFSLKSCKIKYEIRMVGDEIPVELIDWAKDKYRKKWIDYVDAGRSAEEDLNSAQETG